MNVSPLPPRFGTLDLKYLDDPEFVSEYAIGDGRGMQFYLDGVHCAACVWITEKLPEISPDAESLRLDLSSGVAQVRLRKGGSFAGAAQVLAKLGYTPHPVKNDESEEHQRRENRLHLIRMGVAAASAGNIMLLAIALYAGVDGVLAGVFQWVSAALFLPVLFFSAVPFYKSAWGAIRSKKVSIDIPIVFGLLIGTTASYWNLAVGSPHIYFDSISSLIFLLLSTRYLLKKIHQKSLQASQLIYFLAPSRARVRRNGKVEEVHVETLKEGDTIQVLPQECFPVDGVVARGRSHVSRALLTGESDPIRVEIGSRVHAGTLNQDAPLEIEVLSSGAATRLGQILQAMEEGLNRKAPIVTLLDRVGQVFVIAVLVLTVVGFFVGLRVSAAEAVQRAIAVAIIVCPCTFALATPLAMSLAIAEAARRGILVKGAEVLERLSRVKEIFFDKTGTLTLGELSVENWEPLSIEATPALIALESHSSHPIARAVARFFGPLSVAIEVEDFKEVSGVGVSGSINGRLYEAKRSMDGASSVEVFCEGRCIGRLHLGDKVRSDSLATVLKLKKHGIPVHLLSGDRTEVAGRVAENLGIQAQNVVAYATPELKAELVRATPGSLMVGDGANDAVALASAFVSVAVQGGMEVSLRAAGAYSSKPGIAPVMELLEIARRTMGIIRRNLVFAVFYNIVGITVALSGHLDPLFAAILMPMSAFTVFVATLVGARRMKSI